MDGISDFLLTNRIWQRLQDAYYYATYDCNRYLARKLFPVGFEKANFFFKFLFFELPRERARNQGKPLVDILQECKALIPIAYKELNSTNNHMSLKLDPSRVEPLMSLSTLVNILITS
jgi:hypothetical protein